MKIRVLHIITRLVRGGADENTIYTVNGLDKSLFQVDLVYGEGSEPDQVTPPVNPEVQRFLIPELRRELGLSSDIHAFWRLLQVIRRGKYHVVHTHTAKAGFLGRVAAFFARTPIVIHTLHGATFGDFVSPVQRRFYIALEKITTSVTDRVISVGEDLKLRYLNHSIGSPQKYIVIYSGMELSQFYSVGRLSEEEKYHIKESLGLSPSDVVVGNISRLEPRKGHNFLLEAAEQLVKKHPNIRFLIVGDGDSRLFLEQEALQRKISQNVIFTGFRRDIARVLSIFDISVLTSLWEGLPRVLVQSAAAGKPIVTFAVEGATEVVKEGNNGFIVPLRDVSNFVDKVSWLLDHPTEAKQMGIRGRKMVSDAWQVETMVESIQKLYLELLANNGIL